MSKQTENQEDDLIFGDVEAEENYYKAEKQERIRELRKGNRRLRAQLDEERPPADCNCGGKINYSSGECDSCNYPDPVL